MNKRIAEAFVHGKAFIPFLTCGDPSLETTEQLVYACEEAGADLVIDSISELPAAIEELNRRMEKEGDRK